MVLAYPIFLRILLLDVKAFEEGMKNLLAELKETYMPPGMLNSHTVQWSHRFWVFKISIQTFVFSVQLLLVRNYTTKITVSYIINRSDCVTMVLSVFGYFLMRNFFFLDTVSSVVHTHPAN